MYKSWEVKMITALVPCRKGSQRVKDKNTRNFAGTSLIQLKLEQLKNVQEIDNIIVSTDDTQVMKIAEDMGCEVEERDKYYCSNACTNDEFIQYFIRQLDIKGHLLFTHVTSPFITEKTYNRAIKEYKQNLETNDSLMAVKKLQSYIWNRKREPINYTTKTGVWPKTQELEPLYFINSGIFLINFELMKQLNDRVGLSPYYFECNDLESIDIDDLEDFIVAEKIYKGLQYTDI